MHQGEWIFLNIIWVVVLKCLKNKGRSINKGYGFVDFKTVEAYEDAVSKLKGIQILNREVRLGKRKGAILNYNETDSNNEHSTD